MKIERDMTNFDYKSFAKIKILMDANNYLVPIDPSHPEPLLYTHLQWLAATLLKPADSVTLVAVLPATQELDTGNEDMVRMELQSLLSTISCKGLYARVVYGEPKQELVKLVF
jgi:hypothetical protein